MHEGGYASINVPKTTRKGVLHQIRGNYIHEIIATLKISISPRALIHKGKYHMINQPKQHLEG